MNNKIYIELINSIVFAFLMLNHQFAEAQKKINPVNDLSVTIHEETVNKLLAALGEINGTSNYEVLLVKNTYTWTVKNSSISIRPDSSFFTCEAFVKTGFFDYKSQVKGNVTINYDEKEDKILIKITRAVFELYTYLFNKKVHIKDIHLEDHFKEPFAFDGPKSYGTTKEFVLPDSTTKTIYFRPNFCNMEVKWKEICTSCEMESGEIRKTLLNTESKK